MNLRERALHRQLPPDSKFPKRAITQPKRASGALFSEQEHQCWAQDRSQDVLEDFHDVPLPTCQCGWLVRWPTGQSLGLAPHACLASSQWSCCSYRNLGLVLGGLAVGHKPWHTHCQVSLSYLRWAFCPPPPTLDIQTVTLLLFMIAT
ncbi:Kelch Domain-Containing Protein 7A [Manis pentadactyla]|nr:Kelch Domain-Containing Protein 7A [Manis pentadactyla]